MKDLQLITLTKDLLREALEENKYWKPGCEVVPFSKNKAQWLLKNDRIENNDVCAILGVENNELVSFIYLIPDWMNTGKGKQKVYWSSRWWVTDKYKDSILSAYTKRTSLEATNNKVVMKYLGADTLTYYKKQPYKAFSKRIRYIFVFNSDYKLLINKIKPLKHITPVLKCITKVSHFVITRINKSRTKTKTLTYRYVSQINDSEWQYIQSFTANDFIVKTQDYINWQIDNDQYMVTRPGNKTQYTCLISSISNKIYNSSFFVMKNNETIGFISALVRDNEFVVRYFLCEDKNYTACLDALIENFIKANCTFLLTEDEILGDNINKKFLSIYKNKRVLVSLIHNDMISDLDLDNKTVFQQDGHFA